MSKIVPCRLTVFTRQNLTPDPQVHSIHESQDTGASADASALARSAKQDYSPEFETAWQAYPKRAGGNSKAAAWKARLKDGVKPEAMRSGVQRYAAYVHRAILKRLPDLHQSIERGPFSAVATFHLEYE